MSYRHPNQSVIWPSNKKWSQSYIIILYFNESKMSKIVTDVLS